MLHHRSDFLRWVGTLVGLDHTAERRIPLPAADTQPVVVVTGVAGSGRTALLDALAARYRNRTPFAHLDLAHPRFAEPAGPPAHDSAAGWRSPLVRLLDAVTWDLTRKPKDTDAPEIPRLLAALVTVALWPPGTPLTRQAALAHANAAIDQVTDRAGNERRARRFGAALRNVMATLPLPVPQPVETVIVEGVNLFLAEVLTHRQRGEVLSWWKGYQPGMPGDGLQKIQDLAQDFHSGGRWRERAEQGLVAALLADLDAGFGAHHRLRTRRPLLLLDNLERDPAGPRLVDLVLRNRRRDHDPLVIVATTPAYLARRWPDAPTVALEQVPTAPTAPMLVAGLSPLRWPDDTLRVFDETYRDGDGPTVRSRRQLGDLPCLIHRLTAGLPLGVGALATAAVRRQDAHGTVDPALLLDLPADAADGATVSERLLASLCPDPELREYLVLFAAAHDAAAAAVLAGRFLDGAGDDPVRRAEAFLRDETRPEPDDRFLVTDTLLRTVLLHRLRVRGTGYGAGWDEVHGCLHAHYAAAGLGGGADGPLGRDEPLRLRHALSLGREAETANRLSTAFDRTGQRAWVEALACVAAAPYGGVPAPRTPPSTHHAAARDTPVDRDLTHRTVARLLRSAWYLCDPLVPPDADTVKRLADDLEVLGREHPSDGQVFYDAAGNWSEALSAWRQDAAWLETGGETA